MPIDVTPEFLEAMVAAMEDEKNLGDVATRTESASMRAVGISRSDAVQLAKSLFLTYGRALATGWDCPVCGKILEEDGSCPDQCEFEVHTDANLNRLETMIALTEIALSVGVHLERARWEQLMREQEAQS